jgi:hypothetical protein
MLLNLCYEAGSRLASNILLIFANIRTYKYCYEIHFVFLCRTFPLENVPLQLVSFSGLNNNNNNNYTLCLVLILHALNLFIYLHALSLVSEGIRRPIRKPIY